MNLIYRLPTVYAEVRYRVEPRDPLRLVQMSSKSSLMLFAVGWVLLALATLPVQASGTTQQEEAAPGPAIAGTFPLFDDRIGVRQAHIAWLAAKEDAGMQATMRYLAGINGSTGSLSSINRDFRIFLEGTLHAGTEEKLQSGLAAMCSTMDLFRRETDAHLNAAGGNPADLRAYVQPAVAGSPAIALLEDQYWSTRSVTELSDFDQWVSQISVPMRQLQVSGYEVTTAQEKLAEITALRDSLANALRARDDTGIEQAREAIHAASIEYARMLRDVQKTRSEYEQMATILEQSTGVLTRSGMMNAELSSLGINCTQAQALIETGHSQISAVQAQVNAGNSREARAAISGFLGTLESLRDAYRQILVREDLPRTTAQGVLSVAQSIDRMSVRMSTV